MSNRLPTFDELLANIDLWKTYHQQLGNLITRIEHHIGTPDIYIREIKLIFEKYITSKNSEIVFNQRGTRRCPGANDDRIYTYEDSKVRIYYHGKYYTNYGYYRVNYTIFYMDECVHTQKEFID